MKKAISEIDACNKKIERLQKENLEYIKLYNKESKKNQELEDKLKNLQA